MGGSLTETLRKKLVEDVRESVFSASSLVRKMDECGYTLNYAALNAIHAMEQVSNGKYSRGIFPSTKTLKRTMDTVHAFGDNILLFLLNKFCDELGGGEFVEFPQELVLRAIVKAYKLLDKAKTERVGVGYACDGTKIDSQTYLELSLIHI